MLIPERIGPYGRKLMARAEGIWQGMGLVLRESMGDVSDDGVSIELRFHELSPRQAELLVAYMARAFRRAHISWKDEDGKAVVKVGIPKL